MMGDYSAIFIVTVLRFFFYVFICILIIIGRQKRMICYGFLVLGYI